MGKTALITGGASGIGRALGEALARRGVTVVLADRQGDVAARVAREITAGGGQARGVELDVRDAAHFEAVVQGIVEGEGRLDYLFNNAGIGVAGNAIDYSRADWDDVIDVNVRGVAYGVQAAYPQMCRQRSGHIINTASMAGLLPMPGAAAYNLSKHAVVGLGKALRIEAAQHGVRVSTLCPGAIRTPILTGGVFGRRVGKDVPEATVQKIWDRFRPMAADAFAREALRGVDAGRHMIIVPGRWRALWWFERLSPALCMALHQGNYRSMLATIEAAHAPTPDSGPSKWRAPTRAPD